MITMFTICYRHGYLNFNLGTTFKDIFIFGALAVSTETFSIDYKNVSFSTTFAVTMAVFIRFGPLTTMIIIVIGQTFKVLKINGTYKHILNTPFYGTLFNYCNLCISLLVSTYCYVKLGGEFNVNTVGQHKLAVLVFFVLMFTINNIIVAVTNSIMSNKPFVYYFINNLRLMSLTIFAMAPLGIILAFIFQAYGYYGVILVLIPVILSRYTFYLYVQAKTQYVDTVDTLMKAIEERDEYTEGHSQRVGELSVKIAKILKYNEWKLEELRVASMLHDVGKIGISDNILNKKGKLSEEEYSIIKSHPQKGYNILKNIKNFEHILPIVQYHHERYDGKGYPDGKCEDDLGIEVFIVQLADSVDAMSTDRTYRKALTKEEILKEVVNNSGTQFHPKVVEAYLKILESEGIVRS
jgi:HD-GYP domain-containing protein (c-di-GMP phosphodiesterase class II)